MLGGLLFVLVVPALVISASPSKNDEYRDEEHEVNATGTISCCRGDRNISEHAADGRHVLYIVLMAPFPAERPKDDPSWVSGHIAEPAVELALNQINERSDILADYELSMIASDTACSGGYEVWRAFVDSLRDERQIVGIVGPGCTEPAIAVATMASRPSFSLVAITPSATSPQLESPSFVNTFATISSSSAYVEVFKQLMAANNWNHVSVLYDERRGYFLDTFRKFSAVVNQDTTSINMTHIVFQSPVYAGMTEIFLPIEDIKEKDRGRVILSFAATKTARIMMCLAYHLEMTYPTYQWVFHDRTVSQFLKSGIDFKYNGVNYKCTAEEIAKAINGSLLVQYKIESEDDEVITHTGQSFGEFEDTYVEELIRRGVNISDAPLNYGNTNYDATWAFALALNKTASRIDLKSYRHGQPAITEEIRKDLYTVRFHGASGPIQFDSATRSPITDIDVYQITLIPQANKTKTLVAQYNGTLYLLPTVSPVYINDTFDSVQVYIHTSLGIIVILITLALLCFAVVLHVTNTAWYKYGSIKATSPNISHLIFSGCYLFGLSIIVYSVQHTFSLSDLIYSVLCNAFRWCLLMGYTLIFGTVLVKVWRVYRLFKHFRNESPGWMVSDNALVVFVVIILCVDIGICIVWDVIDPFMYSSYVQSREQINKIPSLLIRSKCSCTHFNWWVGIVGTYKGTIAVLLVVFSILNRKIRRRDFQHTRRINILIYSLTMMGGVLFPVFFLLQGGDIHISFTILCLMLSTAILMSCLVLFVPPVGLVIKEKMGVAEDMPFSQEIRRRVSTVSILSIMSFNSEVDVS